MKAVRTKKEVFITLPVPAGPAGVKYISDLARYKELTSKMIKIDQKVIDKLAREVNREWCAKNRHRFVK